MYDLHSGGTTEINKCVHYATEAFLTGWLGACWKMDEASWPSMAACGVIPRGGPGARLVLISSKGVNNSQHRMTTSTTYQAIVFTSSRFHGFHNATQNVGGSSTPLEMTFYLYFVRPSEISSNMTTWQWSVGALVSLPKSRRSPPRLNSTLLVPVPVMADPNFTSFGFI